MCLPQALRSWCARLLAAGLILGLPGVSRAGFDGVDGEVDAGFAPRFNAGSEPNAVALQADGKVLVGGVVDADSRYGPVRLHPDGSLDASFRPLPGLPGFVRVILPQPDGRIVFVGADAVVRLNPDGSPDRAFNANVPRGLDRPRAALLQPDGKLLIGSAARFDSTDSPPLPALLRLHADGTLDAGFRADALPGDRNGVAALALQPDGKILVGGNSIEAALLRLNADGSLDPTFLPAMMQPLPPPPTALSGASLPGPDPVREPDFYVVSGVSAIALQADGRVLINSGSFATGGGFQPGTITRLLPDGQLDRTFGFSDGAPPWSYSDVLAPIQLLALPEGRLLASNDVNSYARNQVTRLLPDGRRDSRLFVLFDPTEDFEAPLVRAFALQPDGGVILAGRFSGIFGNPRPGLARLSNVVPRPQLTARLRVDRALLPSSPGNPEAVYRVQGFLIFENTGTAPGRDVAFRLYVGTRRGFDPAGDSGLRELPVRLQPVPGGQPVVKFQRHMDGTAPTVPRVRVSSNAPRFSLAFDLKLPAELAPEISGKYLFFRLDPDDRVAERDETDNVGSSVSVLP